MLAAQLADGIAAADAVREGLAEGLVLNAVAPGALRLAPPLTISDDEIDEGARRLGAALARLAPA
ncbi:aminotransferase class III-fold pyridoxal phosphate-dependent enzyme [Acidimicrobiaceae bacterium USS-CC1]|uniref:Aminotransferase class III-fold pyridoxal phosphate-dependent enzyme n=1 Tax=Acidiferrimicrobium australe TaxID=2664430 RepID=A0ABW9QX58_9ACTN|nr:aminotransferase class III-fold pyridoxal phosphate-dependent enzyme [Acidiferrimicrobium australe]